ncbi:hypothetical protein SASPL_124430 [Salvia splendens]|uniref:Paired amphipathic helix protein Sin3a n=1 Tax=Salvia splendens TaxID=180675 RepID=A0A8X8XQ05_SALSN|nr:hypothetical protein SASPL_124430 [Salvia splendens]
MDPLLSQALRLVREVKSASAADGRDTYGEFLRILEQYRGRTIDPSMVVYSVQTLLSDHPDLLAGFSHFTPRLHSPPAGITCSEFLNRVNLRASVDFINRVKNRFDGGQRYLEFLDCMQACSRGEIDAEAVREKTAGMFGRKSSDLHRELERFLLRPRLAGWSRKRKAEQIQRAEEEEEREDLEIEKRMESLEGARRNAGKLYVAVCVGRVAAGRVQVKKHFTEGDLMCLGREGMGEDFLDGLSRGRHLLGKLSEMENRLIQRKEALEKCLIQKKALEKVDIQGVGDIQ